MDKGLIVRVAIFVGIMGYLLGGEDGPPSPKPPPSGPYTGPMSSLHSESRSMEERDREAMSLTFASGADMIAADKRALIDRTDEAQTFTIGILSFGYQGIAPPIKAYPSVSSAVEQELNKVIGDEIKTMSSSDRKAFEDCLREIGKAVR